MHPLAALHRFTCAGINCSLRALHSLIIIIIIIIITIIGYSISLRCQGFFIGSLSSPVNKVS